MQLGGVRQVCEADGVARGPDRGHHLVGPTSTCAHPAVSLTFLIGVILASAIIQR